MVLGGGGYTVKSVFHSKTTSSRNDWKTQLLKLSMMLLNQKTFNKCEVRYEDDRFKVYMCEEQKWEYFGDSPPIEMSYT